MKQILLGVTAMVAEVSLCERSQPRRVQSSRPGKVLFPQHPLDPDIDRKGAQALVSKEHHAISNLRAYAWQRTQPRTKIDIRQSGPRFEIGFVGCDCSGRA